MKLCNLPSLKKFIIVLFFFVMQSMITAQNTAESVQGKYVMDGIQVLNLKSEIVNQEYVLHIQLPRNYDKSKDEYPVLYLIDSQWDIPLINAIYGEQYYDGFLPDLIIVGITWGGQNPNYDVLRARDLTPANTPTDKNGNAPNFLSFIKKELIPFIDSKFRTKKDDRTLIGSSFGGLFTLYALFHETSLFNRYVLTSPAINWDNKIAFAFEKKYSETNSKLPVKLFAAIGDYEDVAMFKSYFDQIRTRKYEGLEMETRVLENTGHSGGKAEGYTRGLQFVFTRPSLKLGDSILDLYTGDYEMNMGMTINVSKEDGQLVVSAMGQKIKLLAASETEFYAKGFFLKAHITKDDSGKVAGIQVSQYASEINLKKKN